MVPGAISRGFRNPFRSVVRAAVVIVLLALVTGICALMVQAAVASRAQIARLEARVRTLVELREAGAFGTGGFGGDKPVGEEHFSTDTLKKVRRVPHARHLARVEEYVYIPQVDPTKSNAYAMVIGLHPGAALRAIGEVDYEHARIVVGRSFRAEDASARAAVVGRLYALQRLGAGQVTDDVKGRQVVLNGQPFEVIGIYATGNDFGDNHVFIPIEAFRAVYRPGKKLSKIFVTVDSVANVERVVAELKAIEEADVVTTPEAVSTARTTLAGLSLATTVGAALLAALGAALVVFIMVLNVRERAAEIGTLKALGAGNTEIVLQFIAESLGLCALGGVGALVLAAPLAAFLGDALGLPLRLDASTAGAIVGAALGFATLGCLYPVARALRLSPVEALRMKGVR